MHRSSEFLLLPALARIKKDCSARGPDFRCASIEKEVNLFSDYNEGFEATNLILPTEKIRKNFPGLELKGENINFSPFNSRAVLTPSSSSFSSNFR